MRVVTAGVHKPRAFAVKPFAVGFIALIVVFFHIDAIDVKTKRGDGAGLSGFPNRHAAGVSVQLF